MLIVRLPKLTLKKAQIMTVWQVSLKSSNLTITLTTVGHGCMKTFVYCLHWKSSHVGCFLFALFCFWNGLDLLKLVMADVHLNLMHKLVNLRTCFSSGHLLTFCT